MGISMKTTSGKILASVALVGAAAAVAGMGTYGAFTSSTTAEQQVTAGTVTIALGQAGATNTLNVPVAGLLPGDSVEKIAALTNNGNSALNTVTLTTTTTNPSLLTTETTLGLQLKVESCSTGWTGTAAPYGCSVAPAVLASGPIIGSNVLLNVASLASGGADNLRVTTSLPAEAPNAFKGAASTINFDFTATQRTGQVK